MLRSENWTSWPKPVLKKRPTPKISQTVLDRSGRQRRAGRYHFRGLCGCQPYSGRTNLLRLCFCRSGGCRYDRRLSAASPCRSRAGQKYNFFKDPEGMTSVLMSGAAMAAVAWGRPEGLYAVMGANMVRTGYFSYKKAKKPASKRRSRGNDRRRRFDHAAGRLGRTRGRYAYRRFAGRRKRPVRSLGREGRRDYPR